MFVWVYIITISFLGQKLCVCMCVCLLLYGKENCSSNLSSKCNNFTCNQPLQTWTGHWIITVSWNISLTKLSPLISPTSVIRWTNEFYFEHNMWHCLKIAGMNWSWQVFSCSPRQWLPFIICCTFICQIPQSAILICVCRKAKVTLINILQNQKK